MIGDLKMHDRTRTALLILQWSLAVVVLVEACIFTFTPGSAHAFAKTGMPDALRWFLGGGEILGSLLFVIPATALFGGWLLLVVFLLAIVVHLLHGMLGVGMLVVYAASAWAVMANQNKSRRAQ